MDTECPLKYFFEAVAKPNSGDLNRWAHEPRKEFDMSNFSDGQLRQWGNALEAAGFTPSDMTLMGQAGQDRLRGFRDLLRRAADIVTAFAEGYIEVWTPRPNQKFVQVRTVLMQLNDADLIASCLDLSELCAIQSKGADFFRKFSKGKLAIFGWRTVQADSIPYLIERKGQVEFGWARLDEHYPDLSAFLRPPTRK